MSRAEHIVVVAGPTGSGKSTLIDELAAGRLAEFERRMGIERLAEWPRMAPARALARIGQEPRNFILHYDFLWQRHKADRATGEPPALSILESAGKLSFATLWTPAARLRRQVIEGKLQRALQPGAAEALKAWGFKLLPRFALPGLARSSWLKQIDRRSPGRALTHHLLLVETYASPARVAGLYRQWFELCERYRAKTRAHIIVELDRELKFYSREEWEEQIV